ncbi:hypothetical protein IE53DRAFT_254890 [Violaceomyces palustris]|uniref:Uncharacterized protein n=1 Tax=Violaceomyces palustris TaxID=1673888 RepID=A0ACD0NNK7_9BASI|nr:hypothetical protein IE53DRAFT_254890 [Violaceomyces palustris]
MTGACDTALGQSSSMEQQAGGSGTWRPPSLVSNPKDDRIPSRVFTAGERVTIIDVTDPSFQPMRTTFAALDVSSEQPSSSADLSLPRSCSEERYQRGGPVSKTRLEPVKARATSHASALPSTYAASDGPAITQGDDLRSIPGYRSLQERGKSEELPAGSRPSSTNSLPRKRKMMAMRAPPPRSMADPKCSDEKSDLVQRGVAVSLGSSSAQSASNLDSSCPRTTRPGSEAASQASQHASRASSVLSASSPFGVRGRESVGPGSPSLNGSSAKVVKRPKPSKKSKPFPRIPTASLGDGEKEGASRRRSNRIATSSSGNDRSWRLARRNPGSGRGSAWDGLTFCFDEDQEIDFGLWGIVRFPSPPYTPPWLVANEEGNEGASNLSSLTGSRRVTPFEMDGHRGKGKVQGKKNLKGGKAYHKARGPLTGSGFSDDDEVGLAYPSVARDMIEFEKAYKKKIYDYLDLLSYQLRADLGEAPHVDIQELRKRQLIHGTLDDIDSEALSGAAQSAARVKDEIEEASLDGLTGGKGERGQSPGKSTTDGSLAIERLCSENRSLASKQMRQEPGADFRHQEVICRADGATWRHPSDLSHSSLSMGARREESSGNADLLSKQQEYGGRFHGYASSSHRRSRSPTSRNFHPSFQNTEPVSEFDRRLPGRGSDLYGSNLNESRFGQIFGQGYSEIASREAEGDPGHYGTHGFRDWSRLKQDAIGSRFEMQNDGFETRPVGFQGSSRHTITPRDPFDQGYGSQSSGAGNFALGEGRYPSKYDEASDALGLVDYHAPGYGQGRAFPGDARSRFLPDPARGDVITDPTYDLSERSSGRRLDYDPRFQSDRLPLVASDVGGEHLDPSRRGE